MGLRFLTIASLCCVSCVRPRQTLVKESTMCSEHLRANGLYTREIFGVNRDSASFRFIGSCTGKSMSRKVSGTMHEESNYLLTFSRHVLFLHAIFTLLKLQVVILYPYNAIYNACSTY